MRDSPFTDPRFLKAFRNLEQAVSYQRQGLFDEAEKLYSRVIKKNPDYFDALHFYGLFKYQKGQLNDALKLVGKATKINPRSANAFNSLGIILAHLERHIEALASFDAALKLEPNHVQALSNRCNSLNELGRYNDAINSSDRVLAIDPNYSEVYVPRGAALSRCRRYTEALESYERSIKLNPNLAMAWLGRGSVFFKLNRDEEALSAYDNALALKPDFLDAYYSKSLVKLSLGNFEEGWALYEWRWKSKYFTSPVRRFSQKLWIGNDNIIGKTILVHSEQGLGDTIQFYRYLQKFETLGCKLIFETPAPLVPLFAAQKNNFCVVAKGDQLPNFDVHCPLMSLPLAFNTTLATIPASIPYLARAPDKLELWRTILGPKNKPRIGFAWSGNPQHADDIRRSLPLELLLPIISSAAEWHSLQKDVRESDRNSLNSSLAIIDHAPSLNDFSDTAALIAELDLVISIDTAVAHLAGALGKPVWILLPFHSDFRWLRNREDSPWYPTARLFRQQQDGEWGSVIDRLLHELKIFPATR